MKRIVSRVGLLSLAFLAAASVRAASPLDSNPLVKFIRYVIDFINGVLVPLVFALAFATFLWGIFQAFIVGGADEEKRTKGKQLMIWGLVAFFVMVSVWGLVNMLMGTFGFSSTSAPAIPLLDS